MDGWMNEYMDACMVGWLDGCTCIFGWMHRKAELLIEIYITIVLYFQVD